jgi:predicted ATPase
MERFDPSSTLPIFGREQPRARLQQALDRLHAGQGGLILIASEAGIGMLIAIASDLDEIRLE